MDEKKLTYINLSLFFILIIVLFVIVKPAGFAPKKVEIRTAAVKPVRPVIEPVEQPVYDIDSIKAGTHKAVSVEAKDLAEVYANYPEEDVGTSVIKGWASADPKDKKNFMDGLDKQIVAQEDLLKSNPEDKRAKTMLKMSQTLKKLALNNFNYNIKAD